MRQGPIPLFVHGIIEYAIGVFLIAAPFLFDFDSSAATAVAIVGGILTLVIGASTDSPTGLARAIPLNIHMVLDFVVSIVFIASPFLFRFSDDSTATALFIVVGIAGLLLTIATRFKPAREAHAAT